METARFMVNLYEQPIDKTHIKVLDAGAGSGILSCAFIEWVEQFKNVLEIKLVCYENDENILELLKTNLEYCNQCSSKKIEYEIRTENYITSQYLDFKMITAENINSIKFDYVIGNPPYMKISKDSPEALAMPSVCYGAPNMYFLFASMGIFNLKDYGEMVYIIPRSWTSGADFKFSTGKQNELQKAIIEEFAPRLAPNSECLYVGDTTHKDLVKNVLKSTPLGFEITLHDKMPDVVLNREDKNWLYFIESVTSVGPMDPKRIVEITEITKNVTAGKIFVTAFSDFKTYKKFSESLAWETAVWIVEMPDHMIHLNGDKFLGPRQGGKY